MTTPRTAGIASARACEGSSPLASPCGHTSAAAHAANEEAIGSAGPPVTGGTAPVPAAEEACAVPAQGLLAAWPNSAASGQKTHPGRGGEAPARLSTREGSALDVEDSDEEIGVDARPSLGCYSDGFFSEPAGCQGEEMVGGELILDSLSVASSFYPPSRHGLLAGSTPSTPARWGDGSASVPDSEADDGALRDDAALSVSSRSRDLRLRSRLARGAVTQRSMAATPGRGRRPTSSSPRLNGASVPQRKAPGALASAASPVSRQRPRPAATGSLSQTGLLTSPGGLGTSAVTSPGRRTPGGTLGTRRRELSAASARQGAITGSGTSGASRAPTARKKSGPGAASPPAPVVEEELATLPALPVRSVCLDEAHVAVCYGEADDCKLERRDGARWRLQVWPRGHGCGENGGSSSSSGGLSLAVRGIHRSPITSLSLCCGSSAPDAGTAPARSSSSGGSSWQQKDWMVSFSSDVARVWRLDELWEAAGHAADDAANCNGPLRLDADEAEGPEGEEGVSLLLGVDASSSPVRLPKHAVARASAVLLEGSAADVGGLSSGSVAARPSQAGTLLAAVARGEKVVLFSVQPDLAVTRLADLSFSDPLGHLLLTGEADQSDDRMSVWISGVGGKLWSCDVGTGGEGSTGATNLAAHSLLPGIAVHCLAASAVAPGRCYVGGSLAIVQILDSWGTSESSNGAAPMGRVQVAGEEAPVMAVRSLLRGGGLGEEEALVVLLEDGGIFVQDLLSVAGEAVLSGSAHAAVSLGPLPPLTCTLTSGSPGILAASPAAGPGAVHAAWLVQSGEQSSDSGGVVHVAPVPLRQRGSSVGVALARSSGSQMRRPAASASAVNRRSPGSSALTVPASSSAAASPTTTPRGGIPRKKQLSPAAGLGGGSQPASSRGPFEHADSEEAVDLPATNGSGMPGGRRMQSKGRRADASGAQLGRRGASSPCVSRKDSKHSSRSVLAGERRKHDPRTAAAASGDTLEGIASDGELQVRPSAAAGSGSNKAPQRISKRTLSPHPQEVTVSIEIPMAHRNASWVAPGAAVPPPVVAIPAMAASTPSTSSVAASGATAYYPHAQQAYGKYQQSSGGAPQQAWVAAPPSGSSTPQMWRLGSAPPLPPQQPTAQVATQHALQQTQSAGHAIAVPAGVASNSSVPTTSGHPVALQGLASWPTVPSPAPPSSRLSILQSKKQIPQMLCGSSSAASPASLHRPVAKLQASWSVVSTAVHRASHVPPSPPVIQRPVSTAVPVTPPGAAPGTGH
eukprot:TRINITY_DN47252_c0_g1_i1.p1 TRINITY_DN47252_c0_g1~~TRINITY_DN47252_c0_g1_i1.p1  ORF type:complete len:1378 (+),score=204.75 TRINITY_DN47252_c0_g1_i1:365-4135(+)